MTIKRYIDMAILREIRRWADDSLDDIGPGGYQLFVYGSSLDLERSSRTALHFATKGLETLMKYKIVDGFREYSEILQPLDKFLLKLNKQAKERLAAWNRRDREKFAKLYERDFKKQKILRSIQEAEKFSKALAPVVSKTGSGDIRAVVGELNAIISAFKSTRPAPLLNL